MPLLDEDTITDVVPRTKYYGGCPKVYSSGAQVEHIYRRSSYGRYSNILGIHASLPHLLKMPTMSLRL